MKVESILKAKGHDVVTITPDADLQFVLHKLVSLGIGALVVTENGGTVVGTVSERDIVRALNKHGRGLLDLRVKDVLSRNGPTCSPSDSLPEVMAAMTRTRHRHVPVVDENGVLCGIVSIGDVVKRRLEEMELERDVLRDAYVVGR